jgi:hypothetical protein
MAKMRKDGSVKISNQEFEQALKDIVEGREPSSEVSWADNGWSSVRAQASTWCQ